MAADSSEGKGRVASMTFGARDAPGDAIGCSCMAHGEVCAAYGGICMAHGGVCSAGVGVRLAYGNVRAQVPLGVAVEKIGFGAVHGSG